MRGEWSGVDYGSSTKKRSNIALHFLCIFYFSILYLHGSVRFRLAKGMDCIIILMGYMTD